MTPKLFLIEGIPGSGKSTTARLVAEWLKGRGLAVDLYLEGNLDHPADYESVACLDEEQYRTLLDEFPDWRDWLASNAQPDGRDVFFPYRKLEQEFGDAIPRPLLQALARYEIYELPVQKHLRLMQESWKRFAVSAASRSQVTVFECCFLQNPLTFLLGRNTEPHAAAQAHIRALAQAVAPLDPVMFYLQPAGVRLALEDVARTRPVEWLESVITYHTGQGSGKANGWQGFDGLVSFYEMRQQVELDLLPHLPWPAHCIKHQAWEQDNRQILEILKHSYQTR